MMNIKAILITKSTHEYFINIPNKKKTSSQKNNSYICTPSVFSIENKIDKTTTNKKR